MLQYVLPYIYHYFYRPRSLAKQEDNVLGSICPSVCLAALSRLNHLTYDLIIWHVDWPWPWLGLDCKSRSWVKGREQYYLSLRSRSWVMVMGQGQISGMQWSILGARLCRVLQRATTIRPFQVLSMFRITGASQNLTGRQAQKKKKVEKKSYYKWLKM